MTMSNLKMNVIMLQENYTICVIIIEYLFLYVEERLLKEDEEEEVVLYDDDGSKIILDKEALEFTDRYRDSTSDMMKDILGFDC